MPPLKPRQSSGEPDRQPPTQSNSAELAVLRRAIEAAKSEIAALRLQADAAKASATAARRDFRRNRLRNEQLAAKLANVRRKHEEISSNAVWKVLARLTRAQRLARAKLGAAARYPTNLVRSFFGAETVPRPAADEGSEPSPGAPAQPATVIKHVSFEVPDEAAGKSAILTCCMDVTSVPSRRSDICTEGWCYSWRI